MDPVETVYSLEEVGSPWHEELAAKVGYPRMGGITRLSADVAPAIALHGSSCPCGGYGIIYGRWLVYDGRHRVFAPKDTLIAMQCPDVAQLETPLWKHALAVPALTATVFHLIPHPEPGARDITWLACERLSKSTTDAVGGQKTTSIVIGLTPEVVETLLWARHLHDYVEPMRIRLPRSIASRRSKRIVYDVASPSIGSAPLDRSDWFSLSEPEQQMITLFGGSSMTGIEAWLTVEYLADASIQVRACIEGLGRRFTSPPIDADWIRSQLLWQSSP